MAEPSPESRTPHLSAVPDAPAAEPAPRGGNRLVIGLGIALFVALLGWLLAAQQAATLKESLAASNAALATARAELQAFDVHVSEAHGQAAVLVDELMALTGRLGDLRAHLADRPVAGAEPPAAAGEPAER
ncbi:MAG: hypothetical protein QNK05_20855 [Myxococcota bacterium]|nr:hypothetical protein [Myxococcota bacterium]